MKGLRPIIIQDLRESCKSIRTKYSFSPSSFISFDSLLLTEWLMLLFFFSFSDKWSWWSRLRFHQRPRTCSPFSSFFLFLSFFSLILFFLHVGRIVLIVLFSRFLIRKSVCVYLRVCLCVHYGWAPTLLDIFPILSCFFVFLFFHVTHTCIHSSSFWCDFAWQFVSLNIIRKKWWDPCFRGRNDLVRIFLCFHVVLSLSLSCFLMSESLIFLYGSIVSWRVRLLFRLWRTGEREQERTDEGLGWASKKAKAIVVHN